jgi:hypothetical protein
MKTKTDEKIRKDLLRQTKKVLVNKLIVQNEQIIELFSVIALHNEEQKTNIFLLQTQNELITRLQNKYGHF